MKNFVTGKINGASILGMVIMTALMMMSAGCGSGADADVESAAKLKAEKISLSNEIKALSNRNEELIEENTRLKLKIKELAVSKKQAVSAAKQAEKSGKHWQTAGLVSIPMILITLIIGTAWGSSARTEALKLKAQTAENENHEDK